MDARPPTVPPPVPVPQAKLDEMIRRIVASVHPCRIILFGSAARNQLGPHSDLDILVVMPDGTHRGQTAQQIYRDLWGLGLSKDIIVVTENDTKEHGNNPNLVLHDALLKGRTVYAA